ncbi:MAG TPA: signal recognition particle-docking protein FtsY [Caldisericia bacterium]|nr:signal recognition particle-docking protein FtsY [Caldisericia bacterium]
MWYIFIVNLNRFFDFIKIKKEEIESFEEFLILSGFGLDFSGNIVKIYKKGGIKDVKNYLLTTLNGSEKDLRIDDISTYLFAGVNGGGKTTSIAKLGNFFKEKGDKVLFIQGDTFRTGANEQLKIWGDRTGIEVFLGKRGDDPGSVIFDGLSYAKNRGYKKIFIDTAGRLSSKKNLMEELKKIKRVIEKILENVTETILVLDSTEGENLYSQVDKFKETVDITGFFITKIDSTIKPGIMIPIYEKYKIPFLYLSFGEDLKSFEKFDKEKFVNLIFSTYLNG